MDQNQRDKSIKPLNKGKTELEERELRAKKKEIKQNRIRPFIQITRA
ncbi:MAG: hypothetical protein ACFE95_06345 [Candidatus Hodarchaeota archaeon]